MMCCCSRARLVPTQKENMEEARPATAKGFNPSTLLAAIDLDATRLALGTSRFGFFQPVHFQLSRKREKLV